MKDLIDRKELLKIVEEDFSDDCGWWYIEQIEEAPRVEARPVVYGHWIEDTDGWYLCSECRSPQKDTTAFCSWCGAEMLGEY